MAPERVREAAPALVRSKPPEMLPLRVPALARLIVVAAVRTASPVRVSSPELVASPRVRLPERSSRLVSVRAVAESEERRPPVKISVPEPSAASSASHFSTCNNSTN